MPGFRDVYRNPNGLLLSLAEGSHRSLPPSETCVMTISFLKGGDGPVLYVPRLGIHEPQDAALGCRTWRRAPLHSTREADAKRQRGIAQRPDPRRAVQPPQLHEHLR